ncbi:MAG TPA: hypothetical protein VFP10_05835, partial [Candidatus Eisenbacteria bacterium]|nr:hypothetical protein [Candidatus Eisenbacteria bacterium]
GTEQRLKHLAHHRAKNLRALLRGEPLPWDPAEINQRGVLTLEEMDYPSRIEAAFDLEPTPAEERHLILHRRWALHALFTSHPDLAPLEHHLRTEWASLRPQLEKRSSTWAEAVAIARVDPDRERREVAWKALQAIAGPLVNDTAELIRRRELLARSLVATGFPVVAFHFHELDRSDIVGLLDILERYTRRTFEQTKKEIASALGLHDLEPWDMDVGFARLGELPVSAIDDPDAALKAEAERWGFDPSRFPTGEETPNLVLDAWPMWLDPPSDTRALFRPANEWTTLRARFRAFGAALHGAHVATRRHFLEQDSAVMVEATGRIFESLLDDPEWLGRHTRVDGDSLDTHLHLARRRRILELRRDAALTAFENLAYAPSELEPQRLYADVVEHMLQETRRPEAIWASHPDLIFRPFARGAAIAGAMIAAQTRQAL